MNDPKTLPTRYTDPNEASRIYFLPNLCTAGNLFFGFLAIIRCIQAKYASISEIVSRDYYTQAVWFIFLAFICDALDGRIARMVGKDSLFGKEFDSLADVVSFGMAPALMVFFMILSPTESYPFFRQLGWIIGFVYLLCGAVRLARFNVITHPLIATVSTGHINKKSLSYFRGLPIPAAAGMIASLVLVLNRYNLKGFTLALPFLMVCIALLMVSSIPYPNFKNIDWHRRTQVKTFVTIVFIAIVGFMLREITLAVLFLCYIFYGPMVAFRRYFRFRRLGLSK
jgi:CDP-diacylglycerol--serine O-phosphatidyltransferase